MYINIDDNKQKLVEEFISDHSEIFILNNKKSEATAWGKYLGDINRNNILVTFDTEPVTSFAFCFDNRNNIIEVYNVSIGEKKIHFLFT
jgi:hypothetical protein